MIEKAPSGEVNVIGEPDIAAALGRIPSGLFIVTCGDTAMLASWVQQCSFDPPQITLAVKDGRDMSGLLQPGAALAVSILAEGQNAIVAHFAQGKPLADLPANESSIERVSGMAPSLGAAHAVLHARVSATIPAGDHRLIVAEIIGGKSQSDAKPWVHVRKSGLKY
jgi:flavin reductase (DIM6/NTAB) family NADH-FMN oxidoreductase RutF